jgi:hypothetical protein
MRKLITFIARVLACVMGWFRTKEEVVRTTTPTDPVAEHYSWADRFIRRWADVCLLWDWRPASSTCCKFSLLFWMDEKPEWHHCECPEAYDEDQLDLQRVFRAQQWEDRDSTPLLPEARSLSAGDIVWDHRSNRVWLCCCTGWHILWEPWWGDLSNPPSGYHGITNFKLWLRVTDPRKRWYMAMEFSNDPDMADDEVRVTPDGVTHGKLNKPAEDKPRSSTGKERRSERRKEQGS